LLPRPLSPPPLRLPSFLFLNLLSSSFFAAASLSFFLKEIDYCFSAFLNHVNMVKSPSHHQCPQEVLPSTHLLISSGCSDFLNPENAPTHSDLPPPPFPLFILFQRNPLHSHLPPSESAFSRRHSPPGFPSPEALHRRFLKPRLPFCPFPCSPSCPRTRIRNTSAPLPLSSPPLCPQQAPFPLEFPLPESCLLCAPYRFFSPPLFFELFLFTFCSNQVNSLPPQNRSAVYPPATS